VTLTESFNSRSIGQDSLALSRFNRAIFFAADDVILTNVRKIPTKDAISDLPFDFLGVTLSTDRRIIAQINSAKL
jgi:hypothetical protein